MPEWSDYQESAAEFFRSVGFRATTNARVEGVRSVSDVDVLVQFDFAGIQVRWIVECKHWKTKVSKVHVFALREIVADVGADRGVLLCESGFQKGAYEAAQLTNVNLTSLDDLISSSSMQIYSARLLELFDRLQLAKSQYWDIPKDVRIKKGLRFEPGDVPSYSGNNVIAVCENVMARALAGRFPIAFEANELLLFHAEIPLTFAAQKAVFDALDPLITELEAKLQYV